MRTHRSTDEGATLIEVAVIVVVVLAVVVPIVVIMTTRERESLRISCTSDLKNIYAGALTYSNKQHHFPLAGDGSTPPRAHESLNLLLRSTAGRDLAALLFVCPAGDQTPATKAEGKFLQLREENLSYAWTAKRTRNFGNAKNLSSDKYVDGWDGQRSHVGSVMLLRTDSSIEAIDDDELDPDTGLPEGLVR